MTNIGQNTGILKASMNVQQKATNVLLVTESQNLNSGNLRINGLNSSVALVGKAGPLSSSPKTLSNYLLQFIRRKFVQYIFYSHKQLLSE